MTGTTTRRTIKRTIIALAIALALTVAATATWALDRFVIAHVEISDVAAYEAQQQALHGTDVAAESDGGEAATQDSSETVLTDDTYTSGDTSVTVTQYTSGSGDDTVTYYVADGTIIDGIENVEIDTNFGNHSVQGEQPRTAVGVIDDNHLVFVVVDGRDTGYSRGVTTTELAQIMVDLGATTAYNLDGGGSSTMYFNGEVINQPSNGGERGTSDILYIGQ